ncbi:hypothetical protein CsSME_00045090 [Camellia sinensis var. sinensis]
MGFDPLISILKLRGSSYSFTQQKFKLSCICVDKHTHKKVFDHLLMLGIVQSELCHSFQRMLKASNYYISISCSIIFNGKREYN